MAGGRLTTHVLDTMTGRPARGLRIELFRLEGPARQLLKTVETNEDGRVDQPLLDGHELTKGRFELVFAAGAWLRSCSVRLPEPPFLDDIPIRFGISDPDRHYHVPLLLSAYGYTTYRGS